MPPPGVNTEHIERSSQATPLAQDVLAQLQGELSQGAFGHGIGPAQRQSTDALTALLTSLTAERGQGGIDPTGFLDALGRRSEEFTGRQAAAQRDMFGAGGSRFGSQLGQAETDLRRGAASDFAVTSAQSLLDAGKFNETLKLQQGQQLLAGIGQLFDQGTGAINPFLQMASMGILPEEIVRSPNFTSQLLNAGSRVAAAALTGGGSEVANAFSGGNMFDIFGQSTSLPNQPNFNPDVFAGAQFQFPGGSGVQGPGNFGASFDPNSPFFGTFGPGQDNRLLPRFGRGG